MGSAESSQSQQNFYSSLQFVRSLEGNRTLMREPQSGQLLGVVEHTFPTEQQMLNYLSDWQAKSKISHQYYMRSEKQIVVSRANLCSKQHKLVHIFKWQEHSLMDQIGNRIEQKRAFTDKQVWSILCSCVLAMAHLTKNDIVHLTLHPKDIVLTQEGQVKIVSSEMSEYIFDYSYKHGFYYSPETLKALTTRNIYKQSNKSSVFTLGVTLLSVIHLRDMSHLYRGNLSMDTGKLSHYIDSIENKEIKNVLAKMCKLAHYDRISFPELEDMLFEILEKSDTQGSEAFTQGTQSDLGWGDSCVEEQQYQIQKLQESICKMNQLVITEQKQQNSVSSGKRQRILVPCVWIQEDQEDLPNCTQEPLGSGIDLQVLDEELPQKDKETADNSLWEQVKENNMNAKNCANNSVSVSISESLKIVDDKKVPFFDAKTSRVVGPVYVSEHYSRGRYEGYKLDGMRHGFGTFYYHQGGKYCGEWLKNKMQGRGALYYDNNQLAYEGEWSEDQLHGFGVLYNENPTHATVAIDPVNLASIGNCWIKYEGNFWRDTKSGQGTLFLSNGSYFRGEFKNDLPNGKGTFYLSQSNIWEGIWKNGQLLIQDQ